MYTCIDAHIHVLTCTTMPAHTHTHTHTHMIYYDMCTDTCTHTWNTQKYTHNYYTYYTVVAYSTFSIYYSYIIYVAIHVLAITQVASYIHCDSAHIH